MQETARSRPECLLLAMPTGTSLLKRIPGRGRKCKGKILGGDRGVWSRKSAFGTGRALRQPTRHPRAAGSWPLPQADGRCWGWSLRQGARRPGEAAPPTNHGRAVGREQVARGDLHAEPGSRRRRGDRDVVLPLRVSRLELAGEARAAHERPGIGELHFHGVPGRESPAGPSNDLEGARLAHREGAPNHLCRHSHQVLSHIVNAGTDTPGRGSQHKRPRRERKPSPALSAPC